jgi:ureidoglycolate dehydrogenase (NAD+)
VDSHGVLRVPRYVDLLQTGAINPKPEMKAERRAGAIVMLEADRAPGAIAMSRAMDEAIGCARTTGIGWCAARNITHAGAVGYFALQAARAGMAGLVMTASGPLMAYHGSRVPGVSTNPLAISFPTGKRALYVIDMSTSTVAMGRLMSARDARKQVPLGWGIDAQGRDTTQSAKIATLLPMSGAKGSGLSFMIECLCSLTVHNPIIANALESGADWDNPFLNGAAVAIDLAAFGDVNRIREEADRLGDAILSLPAAAGVDRILLPGERGDSTLLERERTGIPLPLGTWNRLLATAKALGVRAPKI